MNILSDFAEHQYHFVKGSRKALFDYCETINPEDFVNQNSSFGRGGSMRNLLVHIANTYEYWVSEVALQMKTSYSTYENFKTIEDVKKLFDAVDLFMNELILKMKDPEGSVAYEINGTKHAASLLKIFSHVITHEYHHKGQILSLSRHLGYVPVDTDILR